MRVTEVIPMRWHQSRGYHTMGRLARGSRALGRSAGEDVKVLRETPGPQRMRAWRPGGGSVACGMLGGSLCAGDVATMMCLPNPGSSVRDVASALYKSDRGDFW